jgi:excisionase family DNA binding protein
MLKKQLSVREVAEIYGIPEWTARKYIALRKMPYRKVGRRIYIAVDRLEAWLAERDVDPNHDTTKTKSGE